MRTTGNRVWAYTPPRVQIPNSPPRGIVSPQSPLCVVPDGVLLARGRQELFAYLDGNSMPIMPICQVLPMIPMRKTKHKIVIGQKGTF